MSLRSDMIRSGREDFDDFLSWLEDHNWCKVTNCCFCYKWKQFHAVDAFGICERTGESKAYDDYCCDAVERIDK